MELWIRSQNKHSLSKVYDLQLDSFNTKKDKVLIINSRTNTDCRYLAEYDTEERALEVLDEIQRYLTPTVQMLDETIGNKQVCQVGNIMTMVYIMPQD